MRFAGVVSGNDPTLVVQLQRSRELLIAELIVEPFNLVVVIAKTRADIVINEVAAVVPGKRKLRTTGQERAIVRPDADIVKASAESVSVLALEHVYEQAVEGTVGIGQNVTDCSARKVVELAPGTLKGMQVPHGHQIHVAKRLIPGQSAAEPFPIHAIKRAGAVTAQWRAARVGFGQTEIGFIGYFIGVAEANLEGARADLAGRFQHELVLLEARVAAAVQRLETVAADVQILGEHTEAADLSATAQVRGSVAIAASAEADVEQVTRRNRRRNEVDGAADRLRAVFDRRGALEDLYSLHPRGERKKVRSRR